MRAVKREEAFGEEVMEWMMNWEWICLSWEMVEHWFSGGSGGGWCESVEGGRSDE